MSREELADEVRPVVFVVDDDRSVREALEDLLSSVGLDVRSFGSTQEFLAGATFDGPACLVLDVRMPSQNGLDFQRQMRDNGLRLPVVFVSGHSDIAMSVRAMKDGAIEFLEKPFRDQDLLNAIRRGIELDRMRLCDEGVAADLRERWTTLTTGEQEVMERVVQGLLNKQIARELSVSEITVKVRRHKLMRKMGATSVADLVRIADRMDPRP